MIETAETLAREYAVSREEADLFASDSHRRGRGRGMKAFFRPRSCRCRSRRRRATPILFSRDEGVRADTTLELLAKLRPILKGGAVTAGNAAQQNDAATACLIVAEKSSPS